MDRLRVLLRGRALASVLVLVLLFPGATQANTVGISVGDKAVFFVRLVTTTSASPKNITSTYTTQFTIRVMEVNTSRSLGLVEYGLTIDSQNASVITPTLTVNSTTIFDPSDNYSYVGSGFYPFVYTDLKNQTNTRLPVTYPINGTYTSYTPILVNSSVVKTQSSIFVSVTIPIATNATSSAYWFMKYNATNGVLENSTILISQFGVSRDFYYTLLSFQHNPPANTPTAPYAYIEVAAAIIAIAVVAVVVVVRRPSRKRRSDARIKEKFGRRP